MGLKNRKLAALSSMRTPTLTNSPAYFEHSSGNAQALLGGCFRPCSGHETYQSPDTRVQSTDSILHIADGIRQRDRQKGSFLSASLSGLQAVVYDVHREHKWQR